MSVAYEPWIVALSVLIAIQGSYVALDLARNIRGRTGLARRLTLAASAFTFGVAIWSMHFVGMLAVRLPMALDYLVLPTLVSLLIAVFVVGVAVFIASLAPLRQWALPLAAAIMGVGIATMHYTGMMALHGSVGMHHDPAYVIASFAVAIGASALGLRLAFLPHPALWRPLPIALSAIVLGLAISGMHYVAMAGLTLRFPPAMGGDHLMPAGAALSSDLLAVVVAVVAFGVSGVFFLTLVPDQGPLGAPVPNGLPEPLIPPRRPEQPPSEEADAEPPLLSQYVSRSTASAAPLGGVGAPQLRPMPTVLPVERQGVIHYLPVEDIVFVQADTHYTTIFDGQTRRFCQLAIGEVEQLLDPARFLRVHRSYLVAVDRIASLRRSGDGGMAQFETAEPASVPVSRARYAALKKRIAASGRVAGNGQEH